MPRSPYVTKGGTIIVFPGEIILFNFPDAKDGDFGKPQFASRVFDGKTEPGTVLTKPAVGVTYGMLRLGRDHGYSSLGITASFDDAVQYDQTTTKLVDGKYVAGGTDTCIKTPTYSANVIPSDIAGPILLGNFRPWPHAAEYKQTHDVHLIGCHAAAAPPTP